ncbi:MAG TPA: metallopeptidase family protein [Limnochordia bacterium]
MGIDAFTRLADRLLTRVPPALVDGLNGGINISPEAKQRPEDPPDVYILGEYVTDDYLGAFIVIYFGSFRALFEDDEIEQELWKTLLHEIRHHVEARAGIDALDREDLAEWHRLWQEAHARDG